MPVGQTNWRWCHKCQGMYFGGSATQGVCPAGGQHDHTGSGNYDLAHDWAAAPGQSNWNWCNKCQGLHFGGSPGVCPAGGAHSTAGSGDYKLVMNAWETPAQTNWLWCNKCQGLHYGGSPGVCPAGGTHILPAAEIIVWLTPKNLFIMIRGRSWEGRLFCW